MECIFCGGEMFSTDPNDNSHQYCYTCESWLIDGEWVKNEEYFDRPKEGDVPLACEACGGPYPLCADGCNLFDD